MIKSTKGFTLVELIVVIAILAILAGVAIPVYNGYINKAADAAFVTELDAIASAAQAANAIEGSISTIEVTEGGIKVTATKLAKDYETDFVLYYPNATANSNTADQGDFTFKSAPKFPETYKNGATWGATGWEAKPAA